MFYNCWHVLQFAGVVVVKEFHNSSQSKEITILKSFDSLTGLPELKPAPGLSTERQWYLYDEIREFCNPEFKDVVCPEPSKFAVD